MPSTHMSSTARSTSPPGCARGGDPLSRHHREPRHLQPRKILPGLTVLLAVLWIAPALLGQTPGPAPATPSAITPSATTPFATAPAETGSPQTAAAGREIGVAETTVGVRTADGRPVRGLGSEDLQVLERGEERSVLEVLPEGRPWRLVVYLDPALAAPRTPPRALRALETLARDLTDLGTVEVVVAEDAPRRVLPPTRDPLALATVLARVGFSTPGQDRLVELRREALVEVQMAGPVEADAADAELADVPPARFRAAAATDAVEREAALVGERLDALLAWVAERSPDEAGPEGEPAADGPAALLWVTDGFDLDPGDFWRRDPRARRSLQGRSGAGAASSPVAVELLTLPPGSAADVLAQRHSGVSRALAALGWIVIPVSLRGDDAAGLEPEPLPGDEEGLENPPRPRILGAPDGGATLDLPHRRTPEQRAREALAREAGPPPVPLDPAGPLRATAAASGGRTVEAVNELPALLDDLEARLRVRYTTSRGIGPALDPDGETPSLVPLAVRLSPSAGPGLDPATTTVDAPAWAGRGIPPAVSDLRARRLLAGELDPGSVTVRAALGVEDRSSPTPGPATPGPAGRPGDPPLVTARIEVQVEPPPGEPMALSGPRRLTLAALPEDGGAPVVLRRTVVGATAARSPAAAAPAGSWTFSGEVRLPAATDRVAVVVEDPATGLWGGTVAGLFDTGGGTGAWDVETGLLPGPKTVNLLRPEGELLTGSQLFETVVDPSVDRVDLYLDGRRRETVDRAPFRATLDLGRLPLRRIVEAVAYDREGTEVGRDALTINGGGGRLRVRIVEPEGPRAAGAVDVTVDLDLPEDGALDRLDLYWRDRLAASLFQPPFRHRLVIPPAAGAATDPAGPAADKGAEGFLRAVARLTDGTSAEDVRYLNGPLAAERVDVRLTELYVVVTDRDGRPVRGLSAEDFEVREDGRRQQVETFSDAGDLPITVGLAIDSSASMFVKLKEVQAAASDFLGRLTPGRDRAFLVDFDDDVRLAAGTTRELDRVGRAGFELVPDGRTSLWQAIVYSLVQLQGAPGRKALVVYSDGADEDEDFSFRTALAFARKVAVPVYVIVSNDEAVRTGGIPIGFPSLGSRLERLTSAVGGRVWLVRRNDDLSGIYRQIQEELSAQYLLGYYPESDRRGDWRRVEVEVEGRGLEARTLAGYEQR